MAKIQVLDGVTYYPRKHISGETCCRCHSPICNATAYVVEDKSRTDFTCMRCIRQLHKKCLNQLQQRKSDFPTDKPLYIGSFKKHSCTQKRAIYIPLLAVFKHGKTTIELPVVQCSDCKCFILDGKRYENHKNIFHDYTLIRMRTDREIPHYTSDNISRIPPTKTALQVPSSVQQAVFHPYQGGSCSGK